MSFEKRREGRVRAAIRKVAGEHAASRDDARAGALNLDVSGRLRSAIVAIGVTQSAVAARANVPEETVSRIISGVTNDPRITTLVKLASALNVTVGWLLGEHTAPFANAETEAVARAIEILRVRIHAPQIDAEPNAVPVLRARVPRRYTVRGATLTFEARGDSMREVGILDGDSETAAAARGPHDSDCRKVRTAASIVPVSCTNGTRNVELPLLFVLHCAATKHIAEHKQAEAAAEQRGRYWAEQSTGFIGFLRELKDIVTNRVEVPRREPSHGGSPDRPSHAASTR